MPFSEYFKIELRENPACLYIGFLDPNGRPTRYRYLQRNAMPTRATIYLSQIEHKTPSLRTGNPIEGIKMLPDIYENTGLNVRFELSESPSPYYFPVICHEF
jgi:hypothetical protein